ncbi:hypothetical protein R4P08_14790, partial [Rhodococcus sp. IEGM 1408]|nr:hypothetical protein [Rhodococcus sp. IEGM 1408]
MLIAGALSVVSNPAPASAQTGANPFTATGYAVDFTSIGAGGGRDSFVDATMANSVTNPMVRGQGTRNRIPHTNTPLTITVPITPIGSSPVYTAVQQSPVQGAASVRFNNLRLALNGTVGKYLDYSAGGSFTQACQTDQWGRPSAVFSGVDGQLQNSRLVHPSIPLSDSPASGETVYMKDNGDEGSESDYALKVVLNRQSTDATGKLTATGIHVQMNQPQTPIQMGGVGTADFGVVTCGTYQNLTNTVFYQPVPAVSGTAAVSSVVVENHSGGVLPPGTTFALGVLPAGVDPSMVSIDGQTGKVTYTGPAGSQGSVEIPVTVNYPYQGAPDTSTAAFVFNTATATATVTSTVTSTTTTTSLTTTTTTELVPTTVTSTERETTTEVPDPVSTTVTESVPTTVTTTERETTTEVPDPDTTTVTSTERETTTVVPDPDTTTVTSTERETTTEVPDPVSTTVTSTERETSTVVPDPVSTTVTESVPTTV